MGVGAVLPRNHAGAMSDVCPVGTKVLGPFGPTASTLSGGVGKGDRGLSIPCPV